MAVCLGVAPSARSRRSSPRHRGRRCERRVGRRIRRVGCEPFDQEGRRTRRLPGHTAQQSIPSVGAIDGGVNLLLAGTDTRSNQGGIYDLRHEQDAQLGRGQQRRDDAAAHRAEPQERDGDQLPARPDGPDPGLPRPERRTARSAAPTSRCSTRRSSRGGLACVVLTVEKLTGAQIPFAAAVDFNGVSAMSNAIGGVTVCLASPVTDDYTNPPLDLPAGENTLVGDQALSFLRSPPRRRRRQRPRAASATSRCSSRRWLARSSAAACCRIRCSSTGWRRRR